MNGKITGKAVTSLDIERILAMIPHRYPFVMVDRVIDLVVGVSAIGIKNVTFNEPHFQGHFPGAPIMPGVLIIESMAQTAAILVMMTLGQAAGNRPFYFLTIDDARFRHSVTPGDTLHVEVQIRRMHNSVWQMKCRARVGDRLVAEATISGGAKLPTAAETSTK